VPIVITSDPITRVTGSTGIVTAHCAGATDTLARAYRVVMSPLVAILLLAGLVGVVTAAGLIGRARSAAPRAARADAIGEDIVPADALGEAATLVQFSTRFCGSCPGVARNLRSLAEDRPGVAHVEVDITDRAEVATRLHILQTPTVLLLDHDGVPLSRFTGAAPRSAYLRELSRVLEPGPSASSLPS
jgi:thiol-disulfide isomerase/thioredoxin